MRPIVCFLGAGDDAEPGEPSTAPGAEDPSFDDGRFPTEMTRGIQDLPERVPAIALAFVVRGASHQRAAASP